MKKILVTGGAGYIGSHTVVELVRSGYVPVILDNFSNSEKFILARINKIAGRKISAYAGDCAQTSDVAKVFKKEGRFHGIIHFAALKAVEESVAEPLRYYRNNLGSMLTMLESVGHYQVPHFVFSSSCTVYGKPDKLPVREDAPLKKSESPYGETKRVGERMLETFVSGNAAVKAVSLRYFNPIGAHPSALIGELPLGTPRNLVPYVAQTAAGIRKKLKVFGDNYSTPDGTCIRDYIHVMDLAAAHVRALVFLEKKSGKNFYDIFNIGTGRGNSVLEIVRTFEKVTGVKVPYEIAPRRKGDIDKIYASAGKAKKELGWSAQLSLEECLRTSWVWQKKISKTK
ncbi:MAG TPA: UDP-glucose 4-epimerase GalE [Candidatus Omnitrophica bacterium]|nr:UDP-glucose 4-epimerase GalE [Candidatus Omnitrophota bacterium]